jgi:hypothetical protein
MFIQWLLGGVIVLGITIRVVYILVHRHLDKKLVAEHQYSGDRMTL